MSSQKTDLTLLVPGEHQFNIPTVSIVGGEKSPEKKTATTPTNQKTKSKKFFSFPKKKSTEIGEIGSPSLVTHHVKVEVKDIMSYFF